MAQAMEARSLPDMAMVSKAAMADNPNNQAMVEVTAVVTPAEGKEGEIKADTEAVDTTVKVKN